MSGHTDDGLGNSHAQPEMETPMAEKLPALPSQLFGSPAPDVMAYLERVKASQPGAVQCKSRDFVQCVDLYTLISLKRACTVTLSRTPMPETCNAVRSCVEQAFSHKESMRSRTLHCGHQIIS